MVPAYLSFWMYNAEKSFTICLDNECVYLLQMVIVVDMYLSDIQGHHVNIDFWIPIPALLIRRTRTWQRSLLTSFWT